MRNKTNKRDQSDAKIIKNQEQVMRKKQKNNPTRHNKKYI